ncbi:MAG: hypothetical protein JWQ08_1895, partial [Deinococcus sp.]|nr:hypothetical protein [Deinococcus sp.]
MLPLRFHCFPVPRLHSWLLGALLLCGAAQ